MVIQLTTINLEVMQRTYLVIGLILEMAHMAIILIIVELKALLKRLTLLL